MTDEVIDFQGHVPKRQYSLPDSSQGTGSLEPPCKQPPSHSLLPSQKWEEDFVLKLLDEAKDPEGNSFSEAISVVGGIEPLSQELDASSNDLTSGSFDYLTRQDTLVSSESDQPDSLLNPISISQPETEENAADTQKSGVSDLFHNEKAINDGVGNLQIKTESGECLDILSIDNQGNGHFIILVEAPPGTHKAKIQELVMEQYGKELKAIEAEYEKRLRLQGEKHSEEIQRIIKAERQERTKLMGIMATLASRQSNTYTTKVNAQNISGAINAADGQSSASRFVQDVTQLNADNQEE